MKKFISLSVTLCMLLSLVGCQLVPNIGNLISGKDSNSQVEVTTPDPVSPDVVAPDPVKPDPEPVEPDPEPVKPEPEPDPEPVTPPIVSGYVEPTELGDSVYDYQVSINGQILQLPMYVDDLLSLGWTLNKYSDSLDDTLKAGYYNLYTFEKDDLKIRVDICNWDINAKPARECVVNGIDFYNTDLKGADVKLPGGIDVFASNHEDALAAYGDPSDEYESTILETNRVSYTYTEDYSRQVKISFNLSEGDIIDSVSIDNFIEPEGFVQGELSTDIPAIAAAYVAPTALSDNPEDYIFELDGALYKLPCPVSEFTKNGWEVVESKSEDIIEGSGSGKVTLRKNNWEFWDYVRNYDENATSVENCFLDAFEMRDHGAKVKVKICGGVEYHNNLDEAFKILEPLGFIRENDEKDDTKGYIGYDGGSSFNGYSMYFYDGEIKDITIKNELKKKEIMALYGLE